MKIEESEAMKEIREIREKIYLEVKDMLPEDRRIYFRIKSEKFKENLKKKASSLAKIEA